MVSWLLLYALLGAFFARSCTLGCQTGLIVCSSWSWLLRGRPLVYRVLIVRVFRKYAWEAQLALSQYQVYLFVQRLCPHLLHVLPLCPLTCYQAPQISIKGILTYTAQHTVTLVSWKWLGGLLHPLKPPQPHHDDQIFSP